MPRPTRKFKDPKEQKKHEERLKKRRQAHARVRSLQMAAEAAPDDVDFAKLVEEEKTRMAAHPHQRHAGKHSPKVTAKARDDMALAFDLMGGVPALVVWGRANPTEFYRLWSRLIPKPAEEASSAMPLESLLAKLATREEMSVRDAAVDIGAELIETGRKQAEEEDWEASRPLGRTVQ